MTDVSGGDWLHGRIPIDGGYPAVAGTGWDAYARILHPAEASGDIDGAFTILKWTWAEAARRRGVGMHALVDWNTIGRQGGQVEVDGLTLSPGQEGCLEPRLLRILASLLAAETSTPDDITVGVWSGFGHETSSRQVATLVFSDEDITEEPQPAPTDAEMDAVLHRLVNEATARLQAGILPSAPEAPLLELPDRDYYLAAATLQSLGDLAEHDHDLASGIQLIWPAGHEWLVASEIDFDSTIVGGSRGLIQRIVDHPGLEAFVVHEHDHFDIDARAVR
ncbi:MAG: hypothetical protein JWP75_3850 [Frondihabitans sp.]|nr:hypothetical protein [Frondihabitans sp.]